MDRFIKIACDKNLYWWKHYSSSCESTGESFAGYETSYWKRAYVRVGIPPTHNKSFNHRSQKFENGVSVYECYYHNMEVLPVAPNLSSDVLFGMNHLCEEKPVFVVSGELLKTRGGDGEPLLNNIKILHMAYIPVVLNRLPFSFRGCDTDCPCHTGKKRKRGKK